MLRSNKTRTLRGLSAILFALLLAALLAGCGKPTATQPPAGTKPPVSQPTSAPTPVPTPAGPARGGTVTAPFQDAPATFDSILGYTTLEWAGLMNLYRGLMIYEGDKSVPDMAEGYEISADGTVYTFTLKPGIKFHNGREVEAADFKYSLERCLDPAWQSWASYYLVSIEGAQAVLDGTTKEATGIQVLDKYTIRFQLTAPDMTFLNILALPNNWVVPKEEVEKWGQDFGTHAVGTGPFMLKEFVAGEKAVFVRNPNFFHEGQPYIDEVVFQFGIDPSTAVMRLEKGEVDVLFGYMVPTADYPRLRADPTYQDWIFQEPSMLSEWIGVNNTVAPLDNLLLRQALNYAIDREKIARLTGGQGEALWGIYPSTAPGYDPSYKPYGYDPERAKAKLAEAGLASGLTLELMIGESPLEATLAQSIQQDLAQVGVTVNIKQVSSNVAMDLMTSGNTQLFLNAWYMIQPDAADLVNNLYMTGAGSNYDFYSNSNVDELATQALGEQNREKRIHLYQQIEHLLMDDAVHVPLYTGISFYMHNPRIQDFFSRSEYGPFFERMWIQP